MFMPKDCREMNLSAIECEIYKAMKGGAQPDAIRSTYGMTQHQYERIMTSIERKQYLTRQEKRLNAQKTQLNESQTRGNEKDE